MGVQVPPPAPQALSLKEDQMDFKEIKSKKLEREYECTLTNADVAQAVNSKLEIARENFQMKGFRKGHTPLNLMKKMFGKSTRGEVIQDLVDGSLRDHLQKTGHKPAMRPNVDLRSGDFEGETDFIFSFKYEILPKVPEYDYKKLDLCRYDVKVDNTAVKKALSELSNSAGSFHAKAKNAKAKIGDQVIIDFSGSIDGVDFEGGTAQDYPLVLGSSSFIPGFEEQLVGKKVGESPKVNVQFPNEYGNKELAGKEAIFLCRVKSVNGVKPAKIDDDLAKKFAAKNLSELEANIITRLTDEYASFSRTMMKKELMDLLEKHLKFDLPQSLVSSELSQILETTKKEEKEVGTPVKDKEVVATATEKKLANRRVTLGLFFAEEGSRNGVQVSQAEYDEIISQEAKKYPGKEKDFIKFLNDNPSAKDQIVAPIFEDKVFDFMVERIEPIGKDISFGEFKKKFDKTMT